MSNSGPVFDGALRGYNDPFEPLNRPAYVHNVWLTPYDRYHDPQHYAAHVQIEKHVFESMRAALTRVCKARGLRKLYEFTFTVSVVNPPTIVFIMSHIRVGIYTAMHPQIESGVLLAEWFDDSGNLLNDTSYSNIAENIDVKAAEPNDFRLPLVTNYDPETKQRNRISLIIEPPLPPSGDCFGGFSF